jgi:hypothetical protein
LTEHRETFRSVRDPGEGFTFVKKQIAYLSHLGRYELVPSAVTEAAIKALGYYCGNAMQRTRALMRRQPVSPSTV